MGASIIAATNILDSAILMDRLQEGLDEQPNPGGEGQQGGGAQGGLADLGSLPVAWPASESSPCWIW